MRIGRRRDGTIPGWAIVQAIKHNKPKPTLGERLKDWWRLGRRVELWESCPACINGFPLEADACAACGRERERVIETKPDGATIFFTEEERSSVRRLLELYSGCDYEDGEDHAEIFCEEFGKRVGILRRISGLES